MSAPGNPDNGAVLYPTLPIAELPTLEPGGTFVAGDAYTIVDGQSDGTIVEVRVTQGTELRIKP